MDREEVRSQEDVIEGRKDFEQSNLEQNSIEGGNSDQVNEGKEKVEENDDKVRKIKDFILSLKKDIEQKDKKIKEYEDMIKRLAADFDNYRKRVSKEKIEYTRFANKDLILDLLPIIDNFDRAISAIDSVNLDENLKEIFVGIKLIHKELINVLMKYGVVKIDVEGNIFDPNISEVVEVDEVEIEDEEEKDIVVKEYVKGYKMYDQVIRPAKVKVQRRRKKRKEDNQSDKETSEGTGDGGVSSSS